jgi:hypothetical protein
MPEPVLHKYLDFGERAMSDLALPSGERVFISVLSTGFAVHRTHLGGLVPGRRLFIVDAADTARLARVIARDAHLLPALPRARQHRDESATMTSVDAATADLTAMTESRADPGSVNSLDLRHPNERPLSLFTRLALTAGDAADLARRFARAFNTAG